MGSVARHELSDNSWPELMQFISACVGSLSCTEREVFFTYKKLTKHNLILKSKILRPVFLAVFFQNA